MSDLKIEESYVIKFIKALEGSTIFIELLDRSGKILCKKTLKTTFWSVFLKGPISMEPGQPTFIFKVRCMKTVTLNAFRYTYKKGELQISNTKLCGSLDLSPGDTVELNFNFNLNFLDG